MSRCHRGGSHMRIGSCVIAVLLAATSVFAHHSNSAFDGDKVMVLRGTVTEWKWMNPHVWIFLSVDEGNGGRVQWEFAVCTPGQLIRGVCAAGYCASAGSGDKLRGRAAAAPCVGARRT